MWPGPKYVGPDLLVAERRRPAAAEREIRERLVGHVVRLLRHLLVPLEALFLTDDVLDHRFEGLVAAGVIAMMVRVDQQLDPFRRALLETGNADLGGVHELAVNGHGAVAVDEVADRSAAADEHPHAAPQFLELRLRRGLAAGVCA